MADEWMKGPPLEPEAAPGVPADWEAGPPADVGGGGEGTNWAGPAAAVAGSGAALAALLLHQNPAIASKVWSGAKTVGNAALSLRQVSMLTGLASLKSLLGNVGGTALASVERGSLAPLKELFSPTTAREALAAFKAGTTSGAMGTMAPPTSGIEKVIEKINVPGRVMGAFDMASRSALERAGMTSEEAAKEMLQAPVWGSLNKSLATPLGRYFVPFRRTPFNQLSEGLQTMQDWSTPGKAAANVIAGGVGAATGAEAEDPKTLALATALTGRRGLTTAAAGAAARFFATGSKRKAMDATQGISPVSDYSIGEGVLGPISGNPLNPPAAVPAWKYLKSLFGVE